MLQDFKNCVWMCFFFWFIVLTSNGPLQYTQLQHLISLKSLSPLFSPSSQATLRKVWLTSNPSCHSKITKACLSIPPETPNACHPGPPSHRLTPSLLKDFIALWCLSLSWSPASPTSLDHFHSYSNMFYYCKFKNKIKPILLLATSHFWITTEFGCQVLSKHLQH